MLFEGSIQVWAGCNVSVTTVDEDTQMRRLPGGSVQSAHNNKA